MALLRCVERTVRRLVNDLHRSHSDRHDRHYVPNDNRLKLNDFSGNYINAEMVKAFISSSEYRLRFGAN